MATYILFHIPIFIGLFIAILVLLNADNRGN